MTGVNDLYAQDSRQLLLAHLYTYMVENNLLDSAAQLFNESPVPRDPHFHEFTSSLPPSNTGEQVLWDWWQLLWSLMPQSAPQAHPVYDHLVKISQVPIPPEAAERGRRQRRKQNRKQRPLKQQQLLQANLYQQYEIERARFIQEREASQLRKAHKLQQSEPPYGFMDDWLENLGSGPSLPS